MFIIQKSQQGLFLACPGNQLTFLKSRLQGRGLPRQTENTCHSRLVPLAGSVLCLLFLYRGRLVVGAGIVFISQDVPRFEQVGRDSIKMRIAVNQHRPMRGSASGDECIHGGEASRGCIADRDCRKNRL